MPARRKSLKAQGPSAPKPQKTANELAHDPHFVPIHVGPRVLNEPFLCNVEDAAMRLGGVSRVTIFALIREGELRRVKVRGRTMIAYEDLRNYVARQLAEEV